MNEFIDLIFTTNEALNIDPTKVSQVLAVQSEGESDKVFEEIRQGAAIGKEVRTYNQWKFFI